MNIFFVTGIGTEIGKTITSAILVEYLKADYWKPIQSGDLDYSDTLKVQKLISNEVSKFHPESYRLTQPFSPHYSAELDGIEIELNKKDAGSLIIRLFSEFGIIGFLSFLFFLIKFKIKQFKVDNIYCLMNILSLTMIIAFSLRNGGYLSIFLNLFCALYFYSYREFNKTNCHY